jgi:hypothetical protein
LKRHIRGIEGFEGELTPKIIDSIVKGIKKRFDSCRKTYIKKDETVLVIWTNKDKPVLEDRDI